MVTGGVGTPQVALCGVAKRQRKKPAPPDLVDKVLMCVVVCEDCGECFEIQHSLAAPDAALATRQAAWLTHKFVWDHIQEVHHPFAITLPAADALKE